MEVVLLVLVLEVQLGKLRMQVVRFGLVPSNSVSCPLSGVHLDVWVHRVLAEVGLLQLLSSKGSFLLVLPLEVLTLSVVLSQERGPIEELVLEVPVLPRNGLVS